MQREVREGRGNSEKDKPATRDQLRMTYKDNSGSLGKGGEGSSNEEQEIFDREIKRKENQLRIMDEKMEKSGISSGRRYEEYLLRRGSIERAIENINKRRSEGG